MPDDLFPKLIAPADSGGTQQRIADSGSVPVAGRFVCRHCQHTYSGFRGRVLVTLAIPRASWLLNAAQAVLRSGFLIIDMLARWQMDILDMIIGNRGYVVVGSALATYFAVFGLIDAKSTQEEARARLERSLFITLVSSGNAASFVSAVKEFGPTQTMRATDHPSWFRFWDWGRTYQPNMEPMRDWAVWRLKLCHTEAKDCSLADEARADLSGADLRGSNLSVVNLSHADLRRTDFSHAYLEDADLSEANLSGASFRGAILRRANLKGANWSDADLRGADLFGSNLTGALDLTQMQLDTACGLGATTPPGLTLKPCPTQ